MTCRRRPRKQDRYPTRMRYIPPIFEWLQTQHPLFLPRNMLEPGCGPRMPFLHVASYFWPSLQQLWGVDVNLAGHRQAWPHDELLLRLRLFEADFTTWSRVDRSAQPVKWDFIATNPPFSLAEEFIRHSVCDLLHVGGIAVFLLRLGFLSSVARTAFYRQLPPACVVVSRRRYAFIYNKEKQQWSADSADYGWFVWYSTKRRSALSLEPRIFWL